MSISRIETILSGGEVMPQSRIEKILVGEDVIPQSRIETLLKEKLGGGGGGTEITDGIVVTARNADGFATAADLYCSDGIIHRYAFGNGQNASTNTAWRYLETLTLKNRITRIDSGAFEHCGELKTIKSDVDANPFEYVESFENNTQWAKVFSYCGISGDLSFPLYYCTDAQCQQFYNAKNITRLSCPNVRGIHQYFAAGCTSLKTVYLPKCQKVAGDSRYPFGNCTALETVEIGSVGNGVGYINTNAFNNCTQTGLSITVYTNGTYADTALTKIRNGATNATIIIKASEDTTYNGTSYAAGETMITSTVEATT